jgi:hypothetical protein
LADDDDLVKNISYSFSHGPIVGIFKTVHIEIGFRHNDFQMSKKCHRLKSQLSNLKSPVKIEFQLPCGRALLMLSCCAKPAQGGLQVTLDEAIAGYSDNG